jgi:hypothetical protein
MKWRRLSKPVCPKGPPDAPLVAAAAVVPRNPSRHALRNPATGGQSIHGSPHPHRPALRRCGTPPPGRAAMRRFSFGPIWVIIYFFSMNKEALPAVSYPVGLCFAARRNAMPVPGHRKYAIDMPNPCPARSRCDRRRASAFGRAVVCGVGGLGLLLLTAGDCPRE